MCKKCEKEVQLLGNFFDIFVIGKNVLSKVTKEWVKKMKVCAHFLGVYCYTNMRKPQYII